MNKGRASRIYSIDRDKLREAIESMEELLKPLKGILEDNNTKGVSVVTKYKEAKDET